MKISKLFLVSIFLLAVLAMGAASASEDLASDLAVNASDAQPDDSLAADVGDWEIEDENNKCLSADNVGEDVIGYDKDDVDVEIYDSYLIAEKGQSNHIVYFYCDDTSVTGTLKVYVDGVQQYSKIIDKADYKEDDDGDVYCSLLIKPADLHITSPGDYNIKVEFKNAVLNESKIHVYAYDMGFSFPTSNEVRFNDETNFEFILPSDAKGKLTLTVNGRTYDVKSKDGLRCLSLNTAGWDLGNYTAVLRYAGDSKYPADTREETIRCIPDVAVVGDMSVGEDQLLTISAPSWMNCDATLFFTKSTLYGIMDVIGRFNSTISIINGYGSYSLSHLGKGSYDVTVHYSLANLSDFDVNFNVLNNNPNYSSSISSTSIVKGKSVTVTLKGPKSGEAAVYVDNDLLDWVKISSGKAKKVISGLSVGKHRITIQFNGGEKNFYSKTFVVTVKDSKASQKISLILKKVKVKKSAKKLVLTATLKINKKAVKGKKLTFKFNGKTLKAKTNKKGVAKVTVKKKVLKKLKVGKKVKYMVKYKNTTMTCIAKVKK